jgi:hypothetical protein
MIPFDFVTGSGFSFNTVIVPRFLELCFEFRFDKHSRLNTSTRHFISHGCHFEPVVAESIIVSARSVCVAVGVVTVYEPIRSLFTLAMPPWCYFRWCSWKTTVFLALFFIDLTLWTCATKVMNMCVQVWPSKILSNCCFVCDCPDGKVFVVPCNNMFLKLVWHVNFVSVGYDFYSVVLQPQLC